METSRFSGAALLLAEKGPAAAAAIETPNRALPLGRALLAGGVRAVVVLLRTDAAEEAISILTRELPELCCGAGDLILPGQAARVKKLGAAFGLCPVFSEALAEEAARAGLPFAACAPDVGHPEMRRVPPGHVRLGRFDEAALAKGLADPRIAAAANTWIAPRILIRRKNWQEISRRARQAAAYFSPPGGPSPACCSASPSSLKPPSARGTMRPSTARGSAGFTLAAKANVVWTMPSIIVPES
ncbi:MAG: hypothetical protein LBR16_04875 [Treponema sp.]|nr:hypothetical protein [Treponema sp.]